MVDIIHITGLDIDRMKTDMMYNNITIESIYDEKGWAKTIMEVFYNKWADTYINVTFGGHGTFRLMEAN